MLSGCRCNEILTLPWDNVHPDAREIRLRDSKTGPRVVGLSPAAASVLEELPRVARNPWVIAGRRPGTRLTHLAYYWYQVREPAGLEDVRLHYLSFRRWVSHLYATVEHVAPDSDRGVAWDPAIYSDHIRHSLGNLILLPHTENTKIGNAEWSKKKLFYRALTAKTQDKKDVVMAQAKKQGLDFGKKTRQLFADNEQLAILESLDAVGTWDRSFIQLRGQRLLELAWDEIWSWLAAN